MGRRPRSSISQSLFREHTLQLACYRRIHRRRFARKWRTVPPDQLTRARHNKKRDEETREAIADELADVCNLVMLFGVHAGIDVSDAVARKMAKNAVKYPPPAE